MHGFNWLDRRGIEGIGFVRAIRTLLTSNLPYILPQIKRTILEDFQKLHEQQPIVDGSCLMVLEVFDSDFAFAGFHLSPVYPMIVKMTVITNALAFFGEDLGK